MSVLASKNYEWLPQQLLDKIFSNLFYIVSHLQTIPILYTVDTLQKITRLLYSLNKHTFLMNYSNIGQLIQLIVNHTLALDGSGDSRINDQRTISRIGHLIKNIFKAQEVVLDDLNVIFLLQLIMNRFNMKIFVLCVEPHSGSRSFLTQNQLICYQLLENVMKNNIFDYTVAQFFVATFDAILKLQGISAIHTLMCMHLDYIVQINDQLFNEILFQLKACLLNQKVLNFSSLYHLMFWVNIKEGVNNYSFEPLDVWSLLKDFPNDEHYYPLCAAIALFTNSEQVREIFILPKYNLPTKQAQLDYWNLLDSKTQQSQQRLLKVENIPQWWKDGLTSLLSYVQKELADEECYSEYQDDEQ